MFERVDSRGGRLVAGEGFCIALRLKGFDELLLLSLFAADVPSSAVGPLKLGALFASSLGLMVDEGDKFGDVFFESFPRTLPMRDRIVVLLLLPSARLAELWELLYEGFVRSVNVEDLMSREEGPFQRNIFACQW